MLKKILIGVGVLVLGFVAVVMAQPTEYHIERSLEMEAEPQVVWDELANFNSWPEWNPWHKMEPSQKTEVSGTPGTVGHRNGWVGEQTGKGYQEIVEAKPPESMVMKLVMEEPMQDEGAPGFTLEPTEKGTRVTWYIDGTNDGFMKKFFAMAMGMETMLGGMFEQGLADLKPIAEKKHKEKVEATAAAAAAAPEEAPSETVEP